MENYFLDPSFLLNSEYCRDIYKRNNGEKLKKEILSLAQQRLYLEVANYVIVSLRENFKKTWIQIFTNPDEFKDEKSAMTKLLQLEEFRKLRDHVKQQTTEKEIEKKFRNYYSLMTGDVLPLQFGVGNWLNMVSGKKIFGGLLKCFAVKDAENNILQGKDAAFQLVKNLLKQNKNIPDDFIKLKNLINHRILNSKS
jgi:hypothetical protein